MITLAQIKSFLSISLNETSKDTLLEGFIADAVSELNVLTMRRLDWQQHTEISNGTGGTSAVLNNYPVSVVTKIEVLKENVWEDILIPPDTISDSAIVLKEIGIVKLLKSYLFPKGKHNIKVIYSSGYKGADIWLPGANYAVNDMVRYNEAIYKCITAHTSGSEFDQAKWELDPAEAVPEALAKGIKVLAAKQFYESPAGKNMFMKSSESIGSKQTNYNDIDISHIVHRYRNTNI